MVASAGNCSDDGQVLVFVLPTNKHKNINNLTAFWGFIVVAFANYICTSMKVENHLDIDPLASVRNKTFKWKRYLDISFVRSVWQPKTRSTIAKVDTTSSEHKTSFKIRKNS
jgi:hypothetical protein